MLGNRSWTPVTLGLPFLLLASAAVFAQQPQVSDPTRNLTPVTDQMLLNPPDGDWLMWRRTYNGYGYSPLEQINKDNVKNLQVAWTWSMTNGPTEVTPIVHDGRWRRERRAGAHFRSDVAFKRVLLRVERSGRTVLI